jgi:hypothetical protein
MRKTAAKFAAKNPALPCHPPGCYSASVAYSATHPAKNHKLAIPNALEAFNAFIHACNGAKEAIPYPAFSTL